MKEKIIETSDVYGRTMITITERTIAETEEEYNSSIGPIVYDVRISDGGKELVITCPNEELARELFNTLNCCADHFTFSNRDSLVNLLGKDIPLGGTER